MVGNIVLGRIPSLPQYTARIEGLLDGVVVVMEVATVEMVVIRVVVVCGLVVDALETDVVAIVVRVELATDTTGVGAVCVVTAFVEVPGTKSSSCSTISLL
jgi:hypothetical protein